jgi:CHAT domain-containing protein
VLHANRDYQKAAGHDRPRVWWCLTGELTFLPIHAAGLTRDDGILECAADYIVSTYTPTLSTLIKSRAGWHAIPRHQVTGILASCRDTLGQTRLDYAELEVHLTKACFIQSDVHVSHSSSPNTTLQQLRTALAERKMHIIHLACHGEQADNALESALLLSDGQLSIQELMTIRLPHAVLAFLSACQTAKGSKDQPDQAIHLAASMLFCGFRSVVGTMW